MGATSPWAAAQASCGARPPFLCSYGWLPTPDQKTRAHSSLFLLLKPAVALGVLSPVALRGRGEGAGWDCQVQGATFHLLSIGDRVPGKPQTWKCPQRQKSPTEARRGWTAWPHTGLQVPPRHQQGCGAWASTHRGRVGPVEACGNGQIGPEVCGVAPQGLAYNCTSPVTPRTRDISAPQGFGCGRSSDSPQH